LTVRARLLLLVTLLVVSCTLGTAGLLAWLAWTSMIDRARATAPAVAEVLSSTAGVAERTALEIDAVVGDSMLTQAYLTAHLVDLGAMQGARAEDMRRRLAAIAARTALDEIWITDSQGRPWLSSMDEVDAETGDGVWQAGFAIFAPLLEGRLFGLVPEAVSRPLDGRPFKYVAVRAIDRPGMVLVGHQLGYLEALHERIGLRQLIDPLLGSGAVDIIWIFDDAMRLLAAGGVDGPEPAPPEPAERALALRAMGGGSPLSELTSERLSVAAPILDLDGIPSGVTLIRLPTGPLKAELAGFLAYAGALSALMLALGIGAALLMSRYISQPISQIAAAAEAVEARSFDSAALAPVARRPDELGHLARVFRGMAIDVLTREEQLDRLVKARTAALEEANRQIEAELRAAQALQSAILPSSFPAGRPYRCHAIMVPARQLAGDFYDFVEIDRDRVGLIIADVSGKGVPAAFFMGISRTLLLGAAREGLSPGACLARANDQLCATNPTNLFVTVFYGILDLRSGELVYANGGHNPPRLVHARDGRVAELPMTGGVALGAMPGLDYAERRLGLAPDDTVFLYTDGISEAQDAAGDSFTEARLDAVLSTVGGADVAEIAQRITDDVRRFTGDLPLHDDVTCLILRWLGPDGAAGAA
jgi:sigma-B regulation protein RsbU (phosphoserine phosphatase)